MNRTQAYIYAAVSIHVAGGAAEPLRPVAKKGKGARPIRRAHRLAALLAAVHQNCLAPGKTPSWDSVWAARCQLGALDAIPFSDTPRVTADGFCNFAYAGYEEDLKRAVRGLALALFGAQEPFDVGGCEMPWVEWGAGDVVGRRRVD